LRIIAGYDGLAVRSATKADKEVIAAATRLKVIGRAGIGVDNIDIPSATARGIVVMNTPSATRSRPPSTPSRCYLPRPPDRRADVSTQAGKWEKNRFMASSCMPRTWG